MPKGEKLQGLARELLAARVWRMRAKRGTFSEIAEELRIGRKLAATLYNEELDRHSLDAEFIDDRKECRSPPTKPS